MYVAIGLYKLFEVIALSNNIFKSQCDVVTLAKFLDVSAADHDS